jgi:hypothetical protein
MLLRTIPRGGACPVSAIMQHILGLAVKDTDWKKLLGKYDTGVAKKASMLKGYSETADIVGSY